MAEKNLEYAKLLEEIKCFAIDVNDIEHLESFLGKGSFGTVKKVKLYGSFGGLTAAEKRIPLIADISSIRGMREIISLS